MSVLLSNAARLKPEIRLAQAVSQFEADLSSEQKATFRTYRSQLRDSPPEPRDVMRLTAEIDRHASRKIGCSRCFGPRMTNFLQAIQQFAALGDLVVGGSQNLIACGVWSLVRTSLLLIVNFSSYLEKLSSLLMAAGRSAPRYQMMAILYPRSKNLQLYLSEYFIVVVRLCHQLLKFTQKSTFGQFASSLNDSDTKAYQSDFDLWANATKEEVSLLTAKTIEEEAQQNSKFRALSSKFSESGSFRQKLRLNLRVLDACSTYDYQTTWKQTRKIGNSTLFNRSTEYRDWKYRENSSTLVYTGKLGSGKSVLLANIVDDLNLDERSKSITVAYFFCRHDILESLKAQTIIGSLARQILRPMVDLALITKLIDEATPVALDVKRLSSLLQDALLPDYEVYFVLDGLDECDSVEREILIPQLRKFQQTFSLHLCVSIRLDPNNVLKLCLKWFTAAQVISIPDENPDIEAFISTELESRIESEQLVMGNPALILEIQDALIEGSQGMFLWVALQIDALCDMKTDDAIRKALADLPLDLPQTFARVLRKSGQSGKPYQRRLLELVTVARRPLTGEELREALSVVPGDAVWDPSRLINDINLILTCCGSLLTVDEEEKTIRLIHHSVKQFLNSGFKDSANISMTIDSANKTMAQIIVTYLNYGIFETQLSTVVVPQISAGSAPSRIIRSTLDSSSSVRDLALKLLKSRKHPNFDIGKTLAETSKLSNQHSVDKFHFYSYAKRHWPWHVFCISKQESIMYDLLFRLFKGSAVDRNVTDECAEKMLILALENEHEAIVMFVLDSRIVDIDPKIEGGEKLLQFAAVNGHEAVVKHLLDKGSDLECEDYMGRTLLSWAAGNGHDVVVKELLDRGAELESEDSNHETPLMWAARHGHNLVVELLLKKGARLVSNSNIYWTPLLMAVRYRHYMVVKQLLAFSAPLESKDDNGWTPLLWAAQAGQDAIVVELLHWGANPNSTDNSGSTPLSWAARFGYDIVVNLLLEKGAQLESSDGNGRTPLLWAVSGGRWATVKLLLENNAKVDSKDRDDWTPLSCAVHGGNKAIVKLLLENNAGVNPKDQNSRTPLFYAAQFEYEAIVKLLLENKAEVDSKDERGRTPLFYAAQGGNKAIAELLQKSNAMVDLSDHIGRTPLSYTAQNGHEAIVKLLLENNAEVDSKDRHSRTPLSYATERGNEAIVKLLLENNADVDSNDEYSRTPLSFATESGHETITQLLLNCGANLESQDFSGRTPLLLAAITGSMSMTKLLLDRGALLEPRDRHGKTPLLWAAITGRHAVVELLLESGADTETKDETGHSLLWWAEQDGGSSMVRLLKSFM